MNRQGMPWRFFYACHPSPTYSLSPTLKPSQINIASTTKRRRLFSQKTFLTFFKISLKLCSDHPTSNLEAAILCRFRCRAAKFCRLAAT
jgi:hypothetical protein